ncbi:siderophore-interacting protein [Nocardioides lianchengensis]|uniref:NADPH-dependent ferric siderophore reductase, contains FAD-binding and SIP domains n=1 Tax=Nocardioides lianchengensis TaxID=1045774 RepID=A0A1G6VW38_9ACTN|nr:siderophore-interacting protein [Nocardioides lianchengensis]NYG11300.1 NADPH-dependent ferric siderophore reductase [Nocardioides lianchengensis]SDD57197.1 NADPH-dependent ferric siderophore reductase, contains FAD-binding and SIP domains [Nocardioides lianchengensis]
MPSSTTLVVTATERLSPGMVRVRFRSDDLSAFAGSTDTDRYVKLVLGTPEEPVVRTYTALNPDVATGTLDIDFVVHGDEGYAGPWAAAAKPGDVLEVRGPGSGYAPDPTADWHLLAGDEAGLPAIRAALEALPADAVGHAVVEAYGADHVQPLTGPAGVEVRWVLDGDLEGAVRALPWREGRVQVFAHGEAQVTMHGLRPYLLKERGVPRQDASISGYWRRGRTEETFRVWKQELAAAEG